MTNGEKIQSIFPNMEWEVKDDTVLTDIDNGSWFNLEWWNAEYNEPTRKTCNSCGNFGSHNGVCDICNPKYNDLWREKPNCSENPTSSITENCIACKYDEIEESDGSHCKKCLAGDSQFKLDKEFVQTIKNNLGVDCNNCKNNFHRGDGTSYCATGDGMCHYECEDPTTKNDLGVGCIDRKKLIDWINIWDITPIIKNPLIRHIQGMPSVTPQEPRKGHCKDCKWWKDSDGLYRRGGHAESQCPINRREVFEGNGYCYMFEPQESEV